MRTELHVPSDLKFLVIVEEWLLGCLEAEFGTTIDWKAQARRFRLVLVEAYSNVVRHAHKDKPNLPVLLRLELRDDNVVLEVWDYGEGYDLSTYLAPGPDDMQDGGYGWLILNRLMDKVEYRLQVNGRNCLSLAANINEYPYEEAIEQTAGHTAGQAIEQIGEQTAGHTEEHPMEPENQPLDSMS